MTCDPILTICYSKICHQLNIHLFTLGVGTSINESTEPRPSDLVNLFFFRSNPICFPSKLAQRVRLLATPPLCLPPNLFSSARVKFRRNSVTSTLRITFLFRQPKVFVGNNNNSASL